MVSIFELMFQMQVSTTDPLVLIKLVNTREFIVRALVLFLSLIRFDQLRKLDLYYSKAANLR